MRRFLIVITVFVGIVYYAMAALDLYLFRHAGLFNGFASCIHALTAAWLSLFLMRIIRRTVSGTSLDERAQIDFGRRYTALSKRHQFDVRARVVRELRNGGRPVDERDAAMQREAERLAFRVLKIGLPVSVLAYWVVCLWLPAGELRVGMLISAVVISGLTIPVMILPDLIRLWTEPDEVRELQVVAIEREA